MSDDYECEQGLLDMSPPPSWVITEVGVEISQPPAKWMLENRRCAIFDIETSQIYTVSLSPSVMERLRAT